MYPIEILPGLTKKIITEKSGILTRFTDIYPISDEFGIKLQAITANRVRDMPDLSCSLLGIYKEEFNSFKIINPALIDYCEPNENVNVPIENEDFIKVENRKSYFFDVEKIHKVEVNYKKDNIDLKAICKVNHTPTKCNYWHFSLNWFLSAENEYWHKLSDEIKKSNWSKERLSKETRSIVRQYARINV